MRRKSRVEAATLGSEVEVGSVGWVVVAAMIVVCPFFQALSKAFLVYQWREVESRVGTSRVGRNEIGMVLSCWD